MDALSRRSFLKRSVAAGAVGAGILYGLKGRADAAGPGSVPMGSVIDLTRCDGCKGEAVPACVAACRAKNADRFPEPVQPIMDYWPQKKHEDWSQQRDVINRLTPYNWTYVETVTVEVDGEAQEVSVPRRCMHCENPTCMNLCPFSAIEQHPSGMVEIHQSSCMGGAKCRDVCPWGIPQRQAGVGPYLNIAPQYLGGGAMFKCDGCVDLLEAGETPACAAACPRGAITFGPREEMRALAHRRAEEIGGYIYGETENGGTSTFYVSKVPFELIDAAIRKRKAEENDTRPGRPGMPVGVGNKLDTPTGLALSMLIAPVAGVAAALAGAARVMKKGVDE